MARFLIGAIAWLLVTAVSVPDAQVPARPDFSGYWELRLDGLFVPTAPLTPAAVAALPAQERKDADAMARCINIGMPAVMNDRAPLDIRQSPSVMAIVAKSQSSTRYIYTDGRQHPGRDEIEATTNGHSIARWDADTLVVDTIGMNDRGLTAIPGGGYRTPASHLTERIRLLPNGQLSVRSTWEDVAIFTRPHAYEFRYTRIASIAEPRIHECFANDQDRSAFLLGTQK